MIATWYVSGEQLPWRLGRRRGSVLVGEIHCETFAQLLIALEEAWAWEMPELLDVTPPARKDG
jgi:hypothetical protein